MRNVRKPTRGSEDSDSWLVSNENESQKCYPEVGAQGQAT